MMCLRCILTLLKIGTLTEALVRLEIGIGSVLTIINFLFKEILIYTSNKHWQWFHRLKY